ncbi:hypothetical protein [Naasia aerilata]|uniref:Integral membrane protein n=1 Tax=Naasia aerilata TaxID=1162966 RepID=A0ABM8G9T6_9MICO|nr:hypothetical protein [Naasia aerilata]BDZ44962.1 hypothetical protein GCM10025866_08710 [Naasia aerilata]
MRQPLGLILLVCGAAMVLPMTAATAELGLVGSAVHAAGWLILPARGGRRVLAALACLLSLYLMLLGPQLAALMAVPLALWFLVRRRPAKAYPLTLAPAVAGLLLTQVTGPYGARIPVLAATAAVAVGAAWVASRFSIREPAPSTRENEPSGR